MAFARNRIEKVNGFGAATLEAATLSYWFYRTTDAIATVAAANYFDGMVAKQMAVGDFILAHCSDGPAMLQVATNTGVHITTTRYGVVRGQSTTVDENDTIVTGLSHVTGVVVSFNDPPGRGVQVRLGRHRRPGGRAGRGLVPAEDLEGHRRRRRDRGRDHLRHQGQLDRVRLLTGRRRAGRVP
jgi:hypothetical protein